MVKRGLLLLSLMATVAGAAAQTQAPQPTAFAITNVRVEVGTGDVVSNAVVVVRDGRISEIRPGAAAPTGIEVIDGAGKTLYPGFFDGFSSRGIKASDPPTVAARPGQGTTAPADFWIGNRKGITPEFRVAENLDFAPDRARWASGVTTTMISPTRGGMRGVTALLDLLPADAADRVLNPACGSAMSFRLGAGAGYPTNLLGGIALLRQVLADAQALNEGAVLYEGNTKPAWMASLEALQPVIRREMVVYFEANQAREIERAIAISEEFGFRLVIVGGREAGRVATLLAEKKIPVILSADPGTPPSTTIPADTLNQDASPMEWREERVTRWREIALGDQALERAGVTFAFSSDGTMANLLSLVRARIGRGLSRGQALKSLTSDAASLLGVGDRLGRVAVGMRANLVLMSGDFADEKSSVERVWVGGRPVLAPEAK